MATWLLVVYLALSGLAVVLAVLVVMQTWEHHRFAHSRLSQVDHYREAGRVALVVPCKGFDLGLERNLRSFFLQDYRDYAIRFVVESADDPAYPVIRRLMARYPHVESRVIVAGHAEGSGQKVHNLRVATAGLPAEVRYLAFADSDARLRRQWLRALVARLDRPEVGATTGYRWFVPARPSLANALLYSINSSIAVFLGSRSPTVVWGGSWAISRNTFEALGLYGAWEGTLSDDLVASRLLLRSGLRVIFEPACMVVSPLDTTLSDLAAFVRRQYLMARFYIPVWWSVILVLVALANLIFLGSVAAVAWGLAAGTGWAWIPAAVTTVLYLLGGLGGLLRQNLALTYLPHLRKKLRRARRFEVWAGPLVARVHFVTLVGSMFGRRVTWRGITYRLGRRGQVLATYRPPRPPHGPPGEEHQNPDAAADPQGPTIYSIADWDPTAASSTPAVERRRCA
jgi:hypothetical protein